MGRFSVDVLIAHPLKHHVYPLAAGIQQSGLSWRLITPFYRKGIGRFAHWLPGQAGRKAGGYYYPGLDDDGVITSAVWALQRFLHRRDVDAFVTRFDAHVADSIECGRIRCRMLITLQDYMPRTVRAAHKRGALIWSDQISNQSGAAMGRISAHYRQAGVAGAQQHSEVVNDEVLSYSDIITTPSHYAASGLDGRIPSSAQLFLVPYGVDLERFRMPAQRMLNDGVRVLARANSVRKGSHLLLAALRKCGGELVCLASGGAIEVLILGGADQATAELLRHMDAAPGISVRAASVPHQDMPDLLASSHLFVMPSLSESMSLICVEAMQCGLPLVVTPYCGVDCFQPGRMGIEVMDDADAVAAGLISAFRKMDQWEAWGMACHQAASEMSWQVYEQKIASIGRGAL